MTNIQHTGTISQIDADRQTEAVKKIMSDRGLNYGPAYDVYIDQEQTRKLRAEATARVKASGIFRTQTASEIADVLAATGMG